MMDLDPISSSREIKILPPTQKKSVDEISLKHEM